MKLSKLALALSTLVCLGGVFIVSGCKDTFGDGDVSGKKWNTTMTVDATDIAVGQEAFALKDGEEKEVEISSTDELKETGKRFFQQISSGAKNQGIRTNIVIDTSLPQETSYTLGGNKRSTVIGLIFDLNEYEDEDGNKGFDFTLVGINPTNKEYYVERFTGVTEEAAKNGLYFNTIKQLGNSYYLSSSKWAGPSATGGSYSKLPSGSYIEDSTEKTFTVGVDIKQKDAATYTVQLGKITTDEKGKTTFTNGTTVATIGSDSIANYTKWTHADKNDETSPLQGEIAVYGFAPYGTKISATFNTGKTKGNASEANTDYVNAFSLAGDVEDDVYAPSLF